MTSPDLETIAALVAEEAKHDYVGIWTVARMLGIAPGHVCTGPDVDAIAQVSSLLLDRGVRFGQFNDEQAFVEWPAGTTLENLTADLERLGRAPDIGEIGWFVSESQ